MTAFASSIGIISIAVVLSLSTGFQTQIDETQSKTLSQFPVTISQITAELTEMQHPTKTESEFPEEKAFTVFKSQEDALQHVNQIDQDFIDYLNQINPTLSNNIGYSHSTQMNLAREIDGEYQSVRFSNTAPDSQNMMGMSMASGIGVSTFPHSLDQEEETFIEKNYALLEGNYPASPTDVVLVVDKNNRTNINALTNLGFDMEEGEKVAFSELVGTTVQMIYNNEFYTKLPTGNFIPNEINQALFENENNQTLTITGVVRVKSDSTMDLLAPGIAYSDTLADEIMAVNEQSEIVLAQEESDVNVMSNEALDAKQKEQFLSYLGGESFPTNIYIYPNNFDAKEQILTYLDAYNEGKDKKETIIYSDLAGTMTSLTGGIMDAITYVLIAFAGISLVTSMIMISIITYTSVIERTKEIGVLKALGARKKDITRVFDAETFILGIASGTLGVFIAWALTFPINLVLYNMTDLKNVASLNPIHGVVLIIVSTILTMLGGHIPARMAAKKDAAIALRSE